MTDMRTDFEASRIEHLDFAPPCEVVQCDTATGRGQRPCDQAAEWAVFFKHHCVPGKTITKLACGPCLARFMNPDRPTRCGKCASRTDVTPRIIRTERIGA